VQALIGYRKNVFNMCRSFITSLKVGPDTVPCRVPAPTTVVSDTDFNKLRLNGRQSR